MAHFSLSWDEYKKSICNGLSTLQQNGEFVDMTLAADGHLVKVHQIIMALASPYIKDLISSANCPHPVIFLNKVSYEILCALLEYIYTGEVRIAAEKVDELLDAGRELHIRGLQDMKLHSTLQLNPAQFQEQEQIGNHSQLATDILTSYSTDKEIYNIQVINSNEDITTVDDTNDTSDDENQTFEDDSYSTLCVKPEFGSKTKMDANKTKTPVMQYTVSNQGRLQMILNRFIYYLKHTNRNKTQQWRCVDYLNSIRCPAYLVTKGDVVVQRTSMHTHAFHDEKILKKVRAKSVYSAIHEAEERSAQEKKSKEGPPDTQVLGEE